MSAYGTLDGRRDEEEEALVGKFTDERIVEDKPSLSRTFYRIAMVMVVSALIIVGALGVAYSTGSGAENFRGDGTVVQSAGSSRSADLKKGIMNYETDSWEKNETFVDELVEAWNAGDELISSCECGWVEVHGCQDTTLPAYLGVDLVELYNQWKLSSATYETYTPEYGLDNITHPLGDYIVKFLTEDNRNAFSENPDKYLPKYGGFCSFGIAAEYCNFDFVWDKDCLGPEASINAWQYIDEKLYFYRSSKPLELFNMHLDIMIGSADQRWSSWLMNQR